MRDRVNREHGSTHYLYTHLGVTYKGSRVEVCGVHDIYTISARE